LTVLTTSGLDAYPPAAAEYLELSGVAVDRVYLTAGYTDKDKEATIGDPGEKSSF